MGVVLGAAGRGLSPPAGLGESLRPDVSAEWGRHAAALFRIPRTPASSLIPSAPTSGSGSSGARLLGNRTVKTSDTPRPGRRIKKGWWRGRVKQRKRLKEKQSALSLTQKVLKLKKTLGIVSVGQAK